MCARSKKQPQGISISHNPLAYLGVKPTTPPNIQEYNNSDPTVRDFFEFNIGDIWINVIPVTSSPPVNKYRVWILVDKIQHDATWILLSSGSGNIEFLQGNNTTVNVPPDINGVIKVPGDASGLITTFGTIATNTLEIRPSEEIAAAFPTDFGGPAIPSSNDLNIFGGRSLDAEQVALVFRENIHTSGAGNTVEIKLNDSVSFPNTTSNGSQGVIYFGGVTIAPGISNTFIHNYGNSNTFLGASAGNLTLTTGSAFGDTGLGRQALTNITTAAACTAVGYASQLVNQSGTNNTSVGYFTLTALTSGIENVAVGSAALKLTTGNYNTAVGTSALDVLAAGDLNTALGNRALNFLTGGTNNISIGNDSGTAYIGTESNNILVGNMGVLAENSVIRIGIPVTQVKCFIAGIRGVTTDVNDAIPVLIDSTGQLGTVSSTAKLKKNIQDMGSESDRVMKLRPVIFNYKSDTNLNKQWGLIAEEVAEIMPELVTYDSNREPYTVRYHDLPVILLNEIKKLSGRVKQLESLVEKCPKKEKHE